MWVKTRQLEGAALDWAVAKATGDSVKGQSIYWDLGGPLIAKHLITVTPHPVDDGPATDLRWAAFHVPYGVDTYPKERWGEPAYGKTYLVAGMRAIVAKMLGAEVDVPDVLVSPCDA